MNATVGRAQTGQWYLRWDTGELFQVTDWDDRAQIVAMETFDGALDEVCAADWEALPLTRAEPPEGWTASIGAVQTDVRRLSQTPMTPLDWTQPLQPLGAAGQAPWPEAWAEVEQGLHGEAGRLEEWEPAEPRTPRRMG